MYTYCHTLALREALPIYGRSHRALLVDAAVLLGQAVGDLALECGERVVPCRELGIGVGVGRRQGLRGGGVGVGLGVGDTGVELALVHRIGGRDAVDHVGDLAFVAAGRRITVPDARSSTRARDRGRSDEHTSELQSIMRI